MKKSVLVAIVSALAVLAMSLPSLFAFEVPEEIIITVPEGEEPLEKFPEVTFSHSSHADISCSQCHHMFEGCGEIMSCRDCHMSRDSRKDPMSFFAAWHAKSEISCLGCHRSMKAEGEETGPVTCMKECHPQK